MINSSFIVLIAVSGYIWVNKKEELQKRIKPASGIALTYQSIVYGIIFYLVAFALIQSFNALVEIWANENFISLVNMVKKFFQDPSSKTVSLFLSLVLSFLASKLSRHKENDVSIGDSKFGEIWSELCKKEAVVVHLKNSKSYIGTIDYVEVSERASQDQKILSLVVLYSGFRDDAGIVDWNIRYNLENKIILHVSMSEIVSFSEYKRHATFLQNGKKIKSPSGKV